MLRKANMPIPKLTNEIITAALAGLAVQKQRIDAQIAQVRSMLPSGSKQSATTPEAAPRKRRKFSAATRRKMRKAQQLRWKKIRGEAEPAPAKAPAKKKRKLSKAGKAAIVAAVKKRWAEKKAQAVKAKSAAAKKPAPPKAKKTAPVKQAPVPKTVLAATPAPAEKAAQ
jgi:hypothetical protein